MDRGDEITGTDLLDADESDLRARLGDLEILYSLADAVARAGTLGETLELALGAATAALGRDRAAILLTDETGRMRFRAWRGLSSAYRERVEGNRPWFGDGDGPAPLAIADVEADDRMTPYARAFAEERIRALAFIPLVHQGRVLGNLTLYDREPHVWTERELRLARTIASHAAAAAERHRAQAQLEESRRQLEIVLRDVADGITVQDRAGRLLYANDAAARTIGAGSAEELLRADLAEIVGRYEMLDESRRPLPLEELPGRRAIAGTAAEQLICYRVRGTGEERWSLVRATPVFNEEGEAEFAVNVIHDVTARRAAEERMRFLAEAGMVLSSSLDWEETLASVARLAVPRIADWCIVYMLERDGGIRRLALEHAGGKAEWVASVLDRHPLDPSADDGVPRVIRTGEPLVVGDMTASRLVRDVERPELLAAELASLQIGPYLGVPLTARGRTLGAISLMQGESGRGFSPAEQEVAEELARRAALAVDNALLFGEAERAARVERRRSEQLRRLSHAALLVNSTVGAAELADILTAQAREIIGAREASATLAPERGEPPTIARGEGTLEAPLLAPNGQWLGMIGVSGPEEGAFTAEDEAILVQLAQMASVALENTRLFGESSRSLALLDALVRTAPVGFAFVDRDLRFARINEAMAAMNGLAPELHLGRRPSEIGEEFQVVDDLFAGVLESGEPVLDLQVDAPDGRSFLASYFPVVVGGGEPLGVGALVVDVTERERAAAERERLVGELESQRALFEAVLRQMPAGLVVTDAEGRIVVSNEQAVELFQDPLDASTTGSAGPSFVGYDERGRRFDVDDWPLSRALAGAVVRDETIEIERADGTRRTLAISAAPVHVDGRASAAVATFGDVTERRRAEERLRFLGGASTVLASSLDYLATLRAVARLAVPRIADWCSVTIRNDDGSLEEVAVVHSDPEMVEWARELRRREPLDPDSPTGVPAVIRSGEPQLVPDVTPELLAATVAREPGLRDVLDKLRLRSVMIVPLVARDDAIGAISFVSSESGRRFGEEDLLLAQELAQRAAVAVDNARLFQAEQEARREAEARATASQALEFVGDAVALVDTGGRVRLWNPAAEAITGLGSAAVVDRPVAEAVPGWATLAQRIPIVRAGESAGRAETLPLDLGGRELWLSISGVEFEEGTVFAFRDVTEERGLERMKSEFVSTVSHELRTPLAAIYGAALTLRRVDTPVAEEHRPGLLAVIADEADRLARIVNDILWTSRIESGSMHVTIESCDPGDLVEAVVQAVRTHLPASISLDVAVAEGLPRVAGDPDKMRQVLTNLLDNAVKYSPGGGTVTIAVERRESVVRFAVSDEGLGIPAADRERIFEKFYRLDPDLNRGVGGTGLGLYICRELVRRMDGRVWVEPNAGQGSTFIVELPAAT